MTARPSSHRNVPPSSHRLSPARATSHFVDANGIKLHYLDYGKGGAPPMLCIHGGAAHAHWFDFVAPPFARDYHVRSLDLRGHGDSAWTEPPYAFQSYASDVKATVEKLDLRDFVLVGHSMGGMVSLMYAAMHPGRVGRLVIVDTRMLMPARSVAKLHEAGARPAKRYATQEELLARYRLEPAGTQMAAPEVIQHMALHGGRQQPDGTWQHKFDRRVYGTFERVDCMPFWEYVEIPALLVKGARSNRIDAQILAEIQARAPQVELAEVPDSDHHIMLDNPHGFVEAVTTFLRQH